MVIALREELLKGKKEPAALIVFSVKISKTRLLSLCKVQVALLFTTIQQEDCSTGEE